MGLRKIQIFESHEKTYERVTCPDTDSELGRTTKVLSKCLECNDYNGTLPYGEDLYIDCGQTPYKQLRRDKTNVKIAGLLAAPKESRIPVYLNKPLNSALNFLDIPTSEFDRGLGHVKRLARDRYNNMAKHFHPDTSDTTHEDAVKYIKKLAQSFERIDNLKTIPLDDLNTVMDLEKGYTAVE